MFARAAAVFILACFVQAPAAYAGNQGSFAEFVIDLYPEASAQGVSQKTFDAAFDGVNPDYNLPDLDLPGRDKTGASGQAEFSKTAEDYLNAQYLAKLAAQGRSFLAQHAAALARIEKASGVDRHILVAIWGRETAYGQHKLPHDAIRALSTLAFVGRRKDLFRQELIFALRMLEAGIPRSDMRSSWAGAVGLTQFMPSEYFKHAADGDGDGRADIWRSVDDALASAAQQLKGKGWVAGETWGMEVTAAKSPDCSLEGPPGTRTVGEWQQLGLKPAGNRVLHPPRADQNAYLMSPAGSFGPAFLAFDNFKVIRLYNTSDLYALFVSNLADRIAGGQGFGTPWAKMPPPRAAQVAEIQERMKATGYPMDKIDGKIGSNTRRQIGIYQKKNGLDITCWPTDAMLAHLRQTATP